MGIMSKHGLEHMRKGAWHLTANHMPKIHKAHYIYIDGELRFQRLTMAQAAERLEKIQLNAGQVAHLQDADGNVLAFKTHEGITGNG